MLKRLLIAAAASGLAAAEAAAQAPLPDFPTEARPGECWARVPAGPAAGPMSAAQAVWTLQRGTGATAIWSLSERAIPSMPAPGAVLDWARVDCFSGQPLRLADAVPPPRAHASPPAPPPPEFLPPARPYAHVQPHFAPPPPHGQPAPEFTPSPFSGHGPYAEGGFPPPPFGERAPFPAPHAFGPPLHPHGHPPRAQARRPVAPWFGGRHLTWPGKTLR